MTVGASKDKESLIKFNSIFFRPGSLMSSLVSLCSQQIQVNIKHRGGRQYIHGPQRRHHAE